MYQELCVAAQVTNITYHNFFVFQTVTSHSYHYHILILMGRCVHSDHVYVTFLWCIPHPPVILSTEPSLTSCILQSPSDHLHSSDNVYFSLHLIIYTSTSSDHVYCPTSDHVYFTLHLIMYNAPSSDHVYFTQLWSCLFTFLWWCILHPLLIMYTAPTSDYVYCTLLWSCILHRPSDLVYLTLLWSCILHPPSDHVYFTLLWSCVLHLLLIMYTAPTSDYVYCTLSLTVYTQPLSIPTHFTLIWSYTLYPPHYIF
jgi:hypothetical protein